jgi:hypothetical protein
LTAASCASTAEAWTSAILEWLQLQIYRPDDGRSTHVWTSETTRRCIPEDSHLHTRRRVNLKSHMYTCCYY